LIAIQQVSDFYDFVNFIGGNMRGDRRRKAIRIYRATRRSNVAGCMPTVRKPRAANARSNAQATRVLPTPVSVPVTKNPRGVTAGSRA
jgi:hypothetical protein